MMNRTSKRWSPGLWLSLLVLLLGASSADAVAEQATVNPWRVCELIVSIEGEKTYAALFLDQAGEHFLAIHALPLDGNLAAEDFTRLGDLLSQVEPKCLDYLLKFPLPVPKKPLREVDGLVDYLREIDLEEAFVFVHPDGQVQLQILRISHEELQDARVQDGVFDARKILGRLPPGLRLEDFVRPKLGRKQQVLYSAIGAIVGVALFFSLAWAYHRLTEGWHLGRLDWEARSKTGTVELKALREAYCALEPLHDSGHEEPATVEDLMARFRELGQRGKKSGKKGRSR